MDKSSGFLRLDGRASEAAKYYTDLFPDSWTALMPIMAHVFGNADN